MDNDVMTNNYSYIRYDRLYGFQIYSPTEIEYVVCSTDDDAAWNE